jgi:hypothetical protein
MKIHSLYMVFCFIWSGPKKNTNKQDTVHNKSGTPKRSNRYRKYKNGPHLTIVKQVIGKSGSTKKCRRIIQ